VQVVAGGDGTGTVWGSSSRAGEASSGGAKRLGFGALSAHVHVPGTHSRRTTCRAVVGCGRVGGPQKRKSKDTWLGLF
jgi:hypothetical protein